MKLQKKNTTINKSKKAKKSKKKCPELSALSVDDFMEGVWPSNEVESEIDDNEMASINKLTKKNRHQAKLVEDENAATETKEMEVEGDDSNDDSESVQGLDSHSHKKSLDKLRDYDPEFYKFLSENDKNLLDFSASESESEDEDKIHKPPENLEVDSDENDFQVENDETEGKSRVITHKMINMWQEQLQKGNSKYVIRTTILAFHAALLRVSPDADREIAEYKVEGSSIFNEVIQLCVLELHPAIKRFLKLPTSTPRYEQLKNSKLWDRIKGIVRFYLKDLLKLLSGVSSPHILAVLLKHLHQMVPFAVYFVPLMKPLLRKLVGLWADGEDTVRVVAFLCLLRISTSQQKQTLDRVLRLMYMAYVKNSKFMSPNTLPTINFLRRSLTEIFALDLGVSYQHAFLYIRQLAIHLRNALTLRKKESLQAVYNWQFVNSLHLWTEVLGATANKPQLKPLIYPVVQVTMGTIKLIPSAQYFPLRFHCVQFLIQLCNSTGTFIPLLPFLLEVLNTYDFNKRHTKVSMKPMSFTCFLRLSKSQMLENGFKDAVIENIYHLMLQYLSNESHRISFPDMVIPLKIQLKQFVKNCKVANFCRKIQQILDKVEENSKIVEKERSKTSINLNDSKAIDAWETNLRVKGTPLMVFYESWSKVHSQKIAKRITENDKLGDFKLPVLRKRPKTVPETKSEGPVELFPSDESDIDNFGPTEDGERRKEKLQKKRSTRGGKVNKLKTRKKNHHIEEYNGEMDDMDVVEDLKLEDLE